MRPPLSSFNSHATALHPALALVIQTHLRGRMHACKAQLPGNVRGCMHACKAQLHGNEPAELASIACCRFGMRRLEDVS